jgi:Bacterial SH3 domain
MENYQVTATELNIRSIPSKDGAKIGKLLKNEVISSTEKSGDLKWLKIRKEGIDGWSSLNYLRLLPTESPFDYSKFPFLRTLTRDKRLTAEQSKNFYIKGIVPLCDDKTQFNKARTEGYVEVEWAQAAPCATTTSAVLEFAFRLAGMPSEEQIFNDHSKFGPTHEVEKMLYRLGFNYWLKRSHKSQKGAIGLLAGRYTFHGTEKHSGHIYTIFSEIDEKYDRIGDNGGYDHPYRGEGWEIGTEGFWLPSGIVPQRR